MTVNVLVTAQATSKIVCLRAVFRRGWVEAAAWRMRTSSLKPWSLKFFRWGFRLTTPLIGTSAGVWL